jgi:hypothetical protein
MQNTYWCYVNGVYKNAVFIGTKEEWLEYADENGFDGQLGFNEPSQLTELELWRENISLSKGQFCINAYNAGFLSEEDAVTAAKGDWPESFTTALSGLTPSQIVEAKIEWALVTTVRRNAPLLEMVRASQNISEEVLDALFGLTE